MLTKIENLLIEMKDWKVLLDYFSNLDNVEYSRVEMDKEYFLDVFEIYLENNKEMGIEIVGLENLIDSVRNLDISIVVSHSIESESKEIIIYTDIETSKIIGRVYPNMNRKKLIL